MPRNSPKWPDELKSPIVLDELVARPGLFGLSDPKVFEQRLSDKTLAACSARLNVVSQFLGYSRIPESPGEWMSFVIKICNHWEIPAFQISKSKPRGAGASKIWTNHKLCELFADVQSLVVGSALTEHAACKYIAAHPGKFGRRYSPPKKAQPGDWGKTPHRQFLRAKDMVKHNFAFRMTYFGEVGPGLLRPTPEYGPNFMRIAIERYAVARNSKPSKSA